jgi:hypothetical protein
MRSYIITLLNTKIDGGDGDRVKRLAGHLDIVFCRGTKCMPFSFHSSPVFLRPIFSWYGRMARAKPKACPWDVPEERSRLKAILRT